MTDCYLGMRFQTHTLHYIDTGSAALNHLVLEGSISITKHTLSGVYIPWYHILKPVQILWYQNVLELICPVWDGYQLTLQSHLTGVWTWSVHAVCCSVGIPFIGMEPLTISRRRCSVLQLVDWNRMMDARWRRRLDHATLGVRCLKMFPHCIQTLWHVMGRNACSRPLKNSRQSNNSRSCNEQLFVCCALSSPFVCSRCNYP